jgi:transposase
MSGPVELRRAYKFRLYPTEAQAAELSEWERQLRRLYNLAHEQRLASLARFRAPRDRGQCPSCGVPLPKKGEEPTPHTAACAWVNYYRQAKEMTALVAVDDQLARVVCCARQEALRDLEKGWQAFFKRLRGRPRFKRRTDSMHLYFSSPKDWKVSLGQLSFSGMASSVGAIQMNQDQPWPGESAPLRRSKARQAKLAKRPRRSAPKLTSCHVMRDVNEWYAVFTLTFSQETRTPRGGAVGINRGAIHAIADSTGRIVDSPRYYARALETIQRRNRFLARKDPSRKPRPTQFRKIRRDPDEVRAAAARLGVSPGRLVYQARKHGGFEAAVAELGIVHRDIKPENVPTAARPRIYLGRNRAAAATRLAIAHRTVRRQRQWWLHDQSAHYASGYKLVAIEDYSTRKMVGDPALEEKHHFSTTCKRHGCGEGVVKRRLCQRHYDEQKRIPKRAVHRSILDVGWYELARQLAYKTEAAGGRVVKVQPGLEDAAAWDDPARGGISKTCSRCGAPLAESASGHRMAFCDACYLVDLGDVNAATNVLRRALRQKPAEPKTPRASIKIKGRVKRLETPEKPSGAA